MAAPSAAPSWPRWRRWPPCCRSPTPIASGPRRLPRLRLPTGSRQRIGAEQRAARRRRVRFGLALSGATALAVAAMLAIFVLPDEEGSGPEQHVAFSSLPAGIKIGATLEPHAYGTEIHIYVKGVRSGTLCRVYLRPA